MRRVVALFLGLCIACSACAGQAETSSNSGAGDAASAHEDTPATPDEPEEPEQPPEHAVTAVTSTPVTDTLEAHQRFAELRVGATRALLGTNGTTGDIATASELRTHLNDFFLAQLITTQFDGDNGRSATTVSFSTDDRDGVGESVGRALSSLFDGADTTSYDVKFIYTPSGTIYLAESGFGRGGSWRFFKSLGMAQAELTPDRADVVVDPANTLVMLASILELDAPSSVVDDNSFRLELDHATLFEYLPAATRTNLENLGVEGLMLAETSPIDITFEQGRLSKVELVFDDLLHEAARAGGPFDMRFMRMTRSVSVSYSQQIEIDLPAAALVEREQGNDPVPNQFSVGQCFTEKEIARNLPIPTSCDRAHAVEIFHVDRFEESLSTPYPGDNVSYDRALQSCVPAFTELTGFHPAVTLHRVDMFHPVEQTWRSGDRSIACLAVSDQPTTKPLSALDVTRSDATVSAFFAMAGDCFIEQDLSALAYSLVACTEPHRYEAFHHQFFVEDEFPGDAEIQEITRTTCAARFEAFVGIPHEKSRWSLDWTKPSEQSWAQLGDRLFTCFVTIYDTVSETAAGDGR